MKDKIEKENDMEENMKTKSIEVLERLAIELKNMPLQDFTVKVNPSRYEEVLNAINFAINYLIKGE